MIKKILPGRKTVWNITKTSKFILTLLTAFPLLMTQSVEAAVASTLTFKFYDATGKTLTFAQVRALQVGTKSGAYEADAFLDPTSLSLITPAPLTDAGKFVVSLPSGQPVAFAINWPTATQGYGLVILDNGGVGYSATTTVIFNLQAAKDLKRRLDAALTARPDYTKSAVFNVPYTAATNYLYAADQSSVDTVKGAQGQLALDQLVVAYDILLKEYGPAYARAHKATTTPWLGFTMEDVSNYRSDLDKLAAMAGPFAWVRIVFQPEDGPATYTAAVNYAKSKGIKILGEPVDSVADAGYTRAQCLQRFKDFITAFPTIDAWEVGNEVNGGWSSADIASRIADVTTYCKAQGKKTYLTLFWQINTAEKQFAMFNWITANLPPSVRTNLDYVGFSQYQEQAPLGAAFDQVMRRMQVEFPTQQIGIGELGYWINGQQYWWAYNSVVTTAKQTVLEQYYKASLGYARSHGGCFWWNFASAASDYDFTTPMVTTTTALKDYLMTTATNGSSGVPTPAKLTATRSNNVLKVSWPNASPAWVLDKTSSLTGNPPAWNQVPTNQYQASGTNVFFSASLSGTSTFYRLRQP